MFQLLSLNYLKLFVYDTMISHMYLYLQRKPTHSLAHHTSHLNHCGVIKQKTYKTSIAGKRDAYISAKYNALLLNILDLFFLS